MAKAVKSWQIMMWGLTQAGNRAGKTARYLQWQENRPEWLAVTSAVDNWYHSTFLHQWLAVTPVVDNCRLRTPTFLQQWLAVTPVVDGCRLRTSQAPNIALTKQPLQANMA